MSAGDGRRAPQPLHVLREYSLVADGERGALIGPRGDVCWMCAPRWDSGSVFGELLGAPGVYSVAPTGRFVWGGYYEADTLIWRSRWITEAGIVECREALAFPGDPHRAVLLRRIEPQSCDARLEVHFEPAADYGRAHVQRPRRQDGIWTAALGSLHLRWCGAAGARLVDGRAWADEVFVPAGGQHDLVLEISDQPLSGDPPSADRLWNSTETAWARDVPSLGASLTPPDARHAYAVMLGLTAAEGGMVAAASTSLPERADTGRSYDYRYVWIRDQSFAGQAVAADGPYPLLDKACSFVAARLHEHGPELAPAYTVTGERVPDERHLGLPGYPGGSDVVGNHVADQFQLDAFGEALLLFASAAAHDRLDDTAASAAGIAVRAITDRWQQHDAGIWELEPRAWTHSRLTAAAGLRAIAAVRAVPCDPDHCRRLADHLVADTAAHALTADGHWQRSPDDPGVDGALLLPGLRGAVPPDDPRTRATLDAYLDALTSRGYGYRFRIDDQPLGEAEGAFLLCGFLTAMALHQQGRVTDAARWFERIRAAAGPPQLFSEEFDVAQHQMRGNLPQAFVHAYLLEASIRLAR
jgi:GH15 family glucan-1,4-alpha-glucosidase